jgi:hypothetical protein
MFDHFAQPFPVCVGRCFHGSIFYRIGK